MGLVPGNFDPDYSVEEINSRQQLIVEPTVQPSPFVRLYHWLYYLTTLLHLLFEINIYLMLGFFPI